MQRGSCSLQEKVCHELLGDHVAASPVKVVGRQVRRAGALLGERGGWGEGAVGSVLGTPCGPP